MLRARGLVRTISLAAISGALLFAGLLTSPPRAAAFCNPNTTYKCWTVTIDALALAGEEGTGDVVSTTNNTYSTPDNAINCHVQALEQSGTCKHTYQLLGTQVSWTVYLRWIPGSSGSDQASFVCQRDNGDTTCDSPGAEHHQALVITGSATQSDIAFWLQSPKQLTVGVQPSAGGSVSSSPIGIGGCPAPCTKWFNTGTSISLTATPASGYAFQGWDNAGPCHGVSGTVCTFSILADSSVTASFKAAATPPPTATPHPTPTPTRSPTPTTGGSPPPTSVPRTTPSPASSHEPGSSSGSTEPPGGPALSPAPGESPAAAASGYESGPLSSQDVALGGSPAGSSAGVAGPDASIHPGSPVGATAGTDGATLLALAILVAGVLIAITFGFFAVELRRSRNRPPAP